MRRIGSRPSSALFPALLAAISAALVLHAGFSITYTVNYQVTYSPGQGASASIIYTAQAVSNSSYPQQLIIGFKLPPYSTITYSSGNSTASGDVIYWNITVPAYGEASVQVQFTNPLYSINIANLNQALLVNSTSYDSSIINGGNGTLIQLYLGLMNKAPVPPTNSIYLVKQDGVAYSYTQIPSGFATLGSTSLVYWQSSGNYNLTVDYRVTNLGPWRSIRLQPVVIVSTLDTGLYSEYLSQAIAKLNSTIAQLSSYGKYNDLLSNSTKLLTELYDLSTMLNYTANIFRFSAVQVNETTAIERLIQLQAEELKGAVQLEYSALYQLNYTVPQLREAVLHVMSNVSNIIREINTLQREGTSDIIYAYGVVNSANSTLANAQFSLKQLSATVNTQYNALYSTYLNITSELDYLETLINESNINSTQRLAMLAAISAAKTSISTTLGLLLTELGGVRQNIAITNAELSTMEAELTGVGNQLSQRGAQLTSTLTNISDSLSSANSSLFILYKALGATQRALNSSLASLHGALVNATNAVGLATPVYGNSTADSAALMRSAEELSNASLEALRMYFNVSETLLNLKLAINESIGSERANASLSMARYEYELESLTGLQRELESYLVINTTTPYSLDVVVTQSFIINLPAVVDENALLSLINSTNLTAPQVSRGGGVTRIGAEVAAGLAAGSAAALIMALTYVGRRGHKGPWI